MPIEKIKENDWSLAAGRYRAVNAEAVNHDAPADILREVLKVENEIIRRADALLESLARRTGEGRGEGLKSADKK